MDELRKKRKMSDGIRSSKKIQKVKKRTKSQTRSASRTLNISEASVPEKRIKKTRSQSQREENIIFTDTDDALIFSHEKKKLSIKKKPFTQRFLSSFRNNKKIFRLIGFIVLYCVVLFFVFNYFEKTTVQLEAKSENITENTTVQAYLEPKYNQLGFDIISLSESREKKIQATESVSVKEKASGTITIFNNYSREPQRLSPETRFKSVSGKIYKLGQDGITIPGKKNGEAGSIEATIYAEAPGPEYNIDVTDFTIPGFKEAGLSDKYDNIYALSLKPFTGGFIGERSRVGEEQKNLTISELETELKEVLINRLETEKTDKVLLVNNSVQIIFKEPIIESSDESNSTVVQDAQIFALLIEKKQLEKYLENTYLSNENKDSVYFDDFNSILFNYPGGEIDFKQLKNVEITMNVDGSFIWNIDTNFVAESLSGLRKIDVPTILREFDEIDRANIQIRPFWKKTLSDDINRIHFD